MVRLLVWTVLQEDGEELYDKHVEQWQQLYLQGGIDIEGNLKLVSKHCTTFLYFGVLIDTLDTAY